MYTCMKCTYFKNNKTKTGDKENKQLFSFL